AMVVDWLLNEITSGRLPAGSIVRDLDVARALGVSRTPVREAIVLLRSAGALEVVASRYTRVTVLDGATAGQAHLVWVALLGVAVEEVIASDAPFDLAG